MDIAVAASCLPLYANLLGIYVAGPSRVRLISRFHFRHKAPASMQSLGRLRLWPSSSGSKTNKAESPATKQRYGLTPYNACLLYTSRSLPEIGRKFDRDHTTVMHAVRKVEELIIEDQSLAENIEILRRTLENWFGFRISGLNKKIVEDLFFDFCFCWFVVECKKIKISLFLG